MAGLQEDVSCSNTDASPQEFPLKQRQWQEREKPGVYCININMFWTLT